MDDTRGKLEGNENMGFLKVHENNNNKEILAIAPY